MADDRGRTGPLICDVLFDLAEELSAPELPITPPWALACYLILERRSGALTRKIADFRETYGEPPLS